MTVTPLDAWAIAETDLPTAATSADQLRFHVRYAILAPSSHNSQPWLFRISDHRVELYADRTRRLPVVDPYDRELTISCGAALFFLRTALEHCGYTYQVHILPEPKQPDLLARIDVGERGNMHKATNRLFQAIPRRRTNRQPFTDRPVPAALLLDLQMAACVEGVWLHIVHGDDERNAVADLIAAGDRIQWADACFRRELAAWIRPRRTGDGLQGYAFGIAPLIVRMFDLGKGIATRNRQLAKGSPVLAVLGIDADTPADWLTAGQALGRVLLRAAADDLAASFLNQPIEVASLRQQLASLIGHSGVPQVLLRIGYGPGVSSAPRRARDEMLI